MPQFYVVDDLRRAKLNIAHFDRLRDAARAYTALPATSSSQAPYPSLPPTAKAHSLRCSSSPHKAWGSALRGPLKALGVQDGGGAVDLIRRVPTRPRDPDGEDVMVLDILEHPMWKSRPSLLVTAQDLAARFLVRYCLFRGCLLPIPTRDALPKRLRDKRLWASVPGKYETAIHWIEVAGVGKLSLAEFKRRFTAAAPAPLILSLSVHGKNKNGSYCALKVTPWEFHLLVRRSQERLDQNIN